MISIGVGEGRVIRVSAPLPDVTAQKPANITARIVGAKNRTRYLAVCLFMGMPPIAVLCFLLPFIRKAFRRGGPENRRPKRHPLPQGCRNYPHIAGSFPRASAPREFIHRHSASATSFMEEAQKSPPSQSPLRTGRGRGANWYYPRQRALWRPEAALRCACCAAMPGCLPG